MRWAEHVERMGQMNSYNLVWKP